MGYKVQIQFPIDFGNGDIAQCIALEPPEKKEYPHDVLLWKYGGALYWEEENKEGSPIDRDTVQEFHLPPELFVSDGTPGSIVGDWVKNRGGIGGIHHIAYQVDSVEKTMKEWKEKGYAEFTSEVPMECDGLTQVFTKPSILTGIIFEFIEREEFGFCEGNVKNLMLSTANLDVNIK